MLEFPVMMFAEGSDLTPVNENIDKIVAGLTKWEPKIKAKGVYPAEKVTVTGKDYPKAVDNMNFLFLKNMWADGLPLVPATKERVDWILSGTDLPRDTIVGAGKIMPRGGIATVEMLAVALVMAGGRPEYMPLLIASIEAMTEPAFNHQSMAATTNACYPAMIVNGPIANQIRLSSGYGCLGPNPLFPAGASIGRAVRIILLDMGGAIPGIGSMSVYGGPARYTGGPVFAEDEDGSPWEPLSVERGFAKGTNTVSIYTVASTTNIAGGAPGTAEEALSIMYNNTTFMTTVRCNYWGNTPPGILLMARTTAQGIADNLGWTKSDVKAFLWENTKIPWDVIKRSYTADRVQFEIETANSNKGLLHPLAKNEPWPITDKPANFIIAVAGGLHGGHSYWMRKGVGTASVSKEIKLPAKAKWDALLKQAETDLGTIPVWL